MKEIKVKKNRSSIQKSIYGKPRRTISESEFWKKIALQQQVFLHAKNKT